MRGSSPYICRCVLLEGHRGAPGSVVGGISRTGRGRGLHGPLVIICCIEGPGPPSLHTKQTPQTFDAKRLAHRTIALLQQARITHGMAAPRTRDSHIATYSTGRGQTTRTQRFHKVCILHNHRAGAHGRGIRGAHPMAGMAGEARLHLDGLPLVATMLLRLPADSRRHAGWQAILRRIVDGHGGQ
jgi:hypothetical protein